MNDQELRERAGRRLFEEVGYLASWEEVHEDTREKYRKEAWPIVQLGRVYGLREGAKIADDMRKESMCEALEARADEVERGE